MASRYVNCSLFISVHYSKVHPYLLQNHYTQRTSLTAPQRGLIGPIISRFENRGFKLAAIKLVTPSKEHLEKHYEDLAGKPFFPGLIACKSTITSLPLPPTPLPPCVPHTHTTYRLQTYPPSHYTQQLTYP